MIGKGALRRTLQTVMVCWLAALACTAQAAGGEWSATGAMGTARYGHTATLLGNGKVLIAGGGRIRGYLSSAELYDPGTGTFTPTGAMGTARNYHTATLLAKRQGPDRGGIHGGGYLSSAELYDPGTGTFTATGSMGTARDIHTATLLRERQGPDRGGIRQQRLPLLGGSVRPRDGDVHSHGSDGDEAGYCHTATLLQNGKVLIAGGGGGPYNISSAELYDPGTGTFTPTGAMGIGCRYHTATLLPNGKVLVAGGSLLPLSEFRRVLRP